MPGQIVVVGSSNVDLIMKMDRLPQRGESVTDAVFMQTFGGKGANQAVAAAKAGGAVSFINCVGDDSYGSQVIANMRQAGVDADLVFVAQGVATGTALIMIGGVGDNYLSVAPGANYRLMPVHVRQAEALIGGSAMVLLQYEIPLETLLDTIDLAYALGKPIMFNVAPARAFPDAYFPKIDYLVVNEPEAAFLSGIAVESKAQAWQAAEVLLAKGSKMVILTLGAQGCLALSKDYQLDVPAFVVDAVDTTAAGDVFCGSLAVALVEGQSVEPGLRFASAASAIAVTRMGAQPSIPSRAEIDAFLNARS
jgi:ribokinase